MTPDPSDTILLEAEFNPKVKAYWLIHSVFICTITLVLIPIIPIVIAVGLFITGRYLASLRCTLTTRTLKVRRGIFVRQEKTVPLDRITDLGLIQGPVMRFLDLEAFSVETAGQSGQGSLVQLTGIRDGRAFRDAVLRQRDIVTAGDINQSAPANMPLAGAEASGHETLVEIRDVLRRMEQNQRMVG